MNEIELKQTYWASISGGKDSLFMLKLILKYPEKYPLHGVVYFDLEIDYPFIKEVIEKIKDECIRLKIPMFCIKPTKTWTEILEQQGGKLPTPLVRWCNSKYKMSCSRQFMQMQLQYGNSVNWYIGYCFDEKDRYEKRKAKNEIYPLVDFEINESWILEWARKQKIYNNYYLTNDRCGCMYCPCMSRKSMAYLYKYYPDNFFYWMDKVREHEKITGKNYFARGEKYNVEYIIDNIQNKWLSKLNELEKEQQL